LTAFAGCCFEKNFGVLDDEKNLYWDTVNLLLASKEKLATP
jgi:hypothetical protein